MIRFLTLLAITILLLVSTLHSEVLSPVSKIESAILMHPLDRMPLVRPDTGVLYNGTPPVAQRGIQFRRYLSASCQILSNGVIGSGTIVYYDSEKKIAYIATCGHLWSSGVVGAEEMKKMRTECSVQFWYHNNKKLLQPIKYKSEVLFYSNVKGQDTALISFKPDWVPEYFPIAPVNYKYKSLTHYHSCGCDRGTEVAHYDVLVTGPEYPHLITSNNSPRPGRSGGGLMDDHGNYIGTCWGTSSYDGTGNGFFTPIKVIHKFWRQQKDYAFLLDISSRYARKIPIKDQLNPNKIYDEFFVLLPN